MALAQCPSFVRSTQQQHLPKFNLRKYDRIFCQTYPAMITSRLAICCFVLLLATIVAAARKIQLPQIQIVFDCRKLVGSTITTTPQGERRFNHVRELAGFYNDFFPSSLDVTIDVAGSRSKISFVDEDDTAAPSGKNRPGRMTRVTILSSGGTMLLSESTFSILKNSKSHGRTIQDFVAPERLTRYFQSVCEGELVLWKAKVTAEKLEQIESTGYGARTAASAGIYGNSGGTSTLAFGFVILVVTFVVLMAITRIYVDRKVWLSTDMATENENLMEEASHYIDPSKSGFWHTVVNLINSLMGVGLIGLPYVFAKAGLLGGLFLLLFMFFVTWKTAILIGRLLNGDPRPTSYFNWNDAFRKSTCQQSQPALEPLEREESPKGGATQQRMLQPIGSFQELAFASFGPLGSAGFSTLLYADLFSAISIFLILIGDHMYTLFPSISMETHVVIAAVVATITSTLLHTPRQISHLSMLGTFATIYVVGAVVVAAFWEGDITNAVAVQTPPSTPPPYYALWHWDGFLEAFGITMFCFGGQAEVPFIYHSMQKPEEYETALGVAYTIVLVTCVAVALSGYFMFGELVLDQVTISLELYSSFAPCQTFLLYLMIVTSFSKLILANFPLVLFVEDLIEHQIESITSRGGCVTATTMSLSSVAVKAVILGIAAAVAICVPSFSVLSSMVGILLMTIPTIVFPAAAYLKLFGTRLSSREKLLYWSIAIGGTTFAVFGTVF